MLRLIVLLTLLLAPGTAALAAEKEHDREPFHVGERYELRDRQEHRLFSSAERNLIRSWLLENERHEAARHPATGLPAGLRKKAARGKPLPPGWQKKLVRGESLDQTWYGYGSPLPDNLLRRLPPPPPGSEILQIEDRIIRLDAATRTILDVFGLGGY